MEEQPTRRRRGVDRLLQHHRINPERLELAGEGRQVVNAARQAVELRAGEHVEASAPGIGQNPVKRGPAVLCAADAVVDILAGDLQAAGLGVGADGVELNL